jgi:hypothetical protein
MADDLTPQERQVVLMALWNHKLATAQLHASADSLSAGDLSRGMTLVAEIDRVAGRLGGDPYAPAYGLGRS